MCYPTICAIELGKNGARWCEMLPEVLDRACGSMQEYALLLPSSFDF